MHPNECPYVEFRLWQNTLRSRRTHIQHVVYQNLGFDMVAQEHAKEGAQ